MLRVAIGEPDVAYATALASLIGDEPDRLVVGRARDVVGLVELIEGTGAAAAVVATRLPGGGVGAVAEHLAQLQLSCRLVAIASVPTAAIRRTADMAGAALVARGDGGHLLALLTAGEG